MDGRRTKTNKMPFQGLSTIKCEDLLRMHQNGDDSYFDRLNKKYDKMASMLLCNTNEDNSSGYAVKQEPPSPISFEVTMHDISDDDTDEQMDNGFILTQHKIIFSPPRAQIHYIRKSLSTEDIHTMEHNLQQLDLKIKETKRHHSSTSEINRQANASPNRFVAMGEQIYYSQRDSPERIQTTFVQGEKKLHTATDIGVCVPQWGEIRQGWRSQISRSPLTAIPQKEIEKEEIYHRRNYKIKAEPIPRSGTSNASNMIAKGVYRKYVTVPEPFNLTKIKKKEQQKEEKFIFRAKPVPAHILSRPQLFKRRPIRLTDQIGPNRHKGQALSKECLQNQPLSMQLDQAGTAESGELDINHVELPLAMNKPVEQARQVYFSSEERNENVEHKTEKKIKKGIKEEQKISEFEAKPGPTVIKKKLATSSNLSHDKAKAEKEKKSNIPDKTFVAKPATVLKKQSFIPVLKSLHGARSQYFAKKLKEKKEESSRRREEAEEKRRADEKREIAKIRSERVHHAQPVNYYATAQLKPSHISQLSTKSGKKK